MLLKTIKDFTVQIRPLGAIVSVDQFSKFICHVLAH